MKDNHPPRGGFGSNEQGIIKTPQQLLVEANQLIGQMTSERTAGIEHIEKQKWQIAQLRMAVAALAKHHGHTPQDVKKIYDEYCAAEDAKAQDAASQMNEEMKAKFKADIAAGKKIDFTVIERAAEHTPPPEAKEDE